MPTLRRLRQGDPCKFKASQVYQRRNMANQDAVIKPRRKLGFKTFQSSHWSSLSLGRLRAGVHHELSIERRRKISVIIIMMMK